jgi:hypothetical protein
VDKGIPPAETTVTRQLKLPSYESTRQLKLLDGEPFVSRFCFLDEIQGRPDFEHDIKQLLPWSRQILSFIRALPPAAPD